MPNHQEIYLYNEIISANKHQQIILGSHKDRLHQRVVINKIYKSSFVLPVDVHSFINAFTQLVMLEEDPNNWYIITKKEDSPILMPPFNFEHLSSYLRWVKSYDNLAPFYQYLLLKDTNWVLKENQLISKEVLFLDDLPDGFIDFHLVRAKVNYVMSQSVLALLEGGQFTTETPFDLEAVTAMTEAITDLATLCEKWSNLLVTLSPVNEPIPLEKLYALPSDQASTPMAKRRVAETLKAENSQYIDYQNKRSRRNKLNPAIFATLAICVVALAAIFIPSIKSLFTPENEKNVPLPQNNSNTQSESVTNTPEVLQLDNIQLEGNHWSIDKSQFYTGTESIKLKLTNEEPTGQMILSPVSLSQNTTISLWLKSTISSTLTITVGLYEDQILLKEVTTKVPIEAAQTWYLISPLGSQTLSEPERVNKIIMSISGQPQDIWIDDLVIESFK